MKQTELFATQGSRCTSLNSNVLVSINGEKVFFLRKNSMDTTADIQHRRVECGASPLTG